MCDAHIDQPTNLAPGLYPSDPQGHTVVVGQTTTWGEVRSFTVLHLGGVVSIAGVEVHDPAVLDHLADRLHANADSLRANQARAAR